MARYNINLRQDLTGQYFLCVFKDSREIGKIIVGHSHDEALENANDLKDAFTHEQITDQSE